MPHKARVRCFRERVGGLIRVSSKYDVALQTLRQLALDGFVQNSTVMATLMNHYPAEWATMPLRRFKKLYADVVAATNVYASELEFTVVDHWLQKHSIKLYNFTRSSMKRRSYLLGALRSINPAVADRVLLLSTDDLHYNWVTAAYRAYGEQVVNESLMHIDTLIVLLTVSSGARVTAMAGGGEKKPRMSRGRFAPLPPGVDAAAAPPAAGGLRAAAAVASKCALTAAATSPREARSSAAARCADTADSPSTARSAATPSSAFSSSSSSEMITTSSAAAAAGTEGGGRAAAAVGAECAAAACAAAAAAAPAAAAALPLRAAACASSSSSASPSPSEDDAGDAAASEPPAPASSGSTSAPGGAWRGRPKKARLALVSSTRLRKCFAMAAAEACSALPGAAAEPTPTVGTTQRGRSQRT
jgi:hypothetical protein